jgi:hypothetical protein
MTLTLSNVGGVNLTGISLIFGSPVYSRPAGAAGGNCVGTLAAGATCTINVVFAPTAAGAANSTLTVNASVTVTGSPVALSGTGLAATHTATITPGSLAFGTWAISTTSAAQTLTVTNTGNSLLTGEVITFGGGTPQPFSRPSGAAGGTCTTTLAVGATCTVNVVFAPTLATTFNRTFTLTYTAATVTPTPVPLSGTGVTAKATVSITPNPLTITLPTGVNTGIGTATLKNTSAAAGAQFTVTSVAVSGGSASTFLFNAVVGGDTCTGTVLAPGATCTVQVRFTNTLSARGANRAGTITFTDNAAASPQSASLVGFATP